jgi:GT2 family glycosyltransferase
MVDVVVGIPTYFAGRLLTQCVDSVIQHCGNVKVLVYKNDEGWLLAANKIMSMVDTDILLINDDIIAKSNLVKEMQELAYSDPKIGIVGGMSLLPQNEGLIQNYGVHVATDGNTAHKYFGQPKSVVGVENQKAVEGSCIYIKREVLEKIGYFDEGYVAYREEVDLCFRAREAGYKVVSCPTAQYVHLTSQTHARLGIANESYDYFMKVWGRKLKLGQI